MSLKAMPTIRAAAVVAAVAAGAALVVAALPASAATTVASGLAIRPASNVEDTKEATQVEETKETASAIVRDLAQGRTDIIGRAFSDDYVDHAGSGATGTAALVEAVRAQHEAYPQARARIYRVLGEGDLVFVHSNLILQPDTLGYAVADIFRFTNGRVVEHWGGREQVPATTASGNDMFSTLSTPRRLGPDPHAPTADTKATLFGLFGALVGKKDLTAWDRYAQDPYYQHSVNTPNGIAAVKAIWGPLLTDPNLSISLVNMVADGDLIVAQDVLQAPGLYLLAFDISRVRDGKIVEHWDVLQSLA